MRKSKKFIIYIFILALIVLYVIICAVPVLTGALTQTEILQFENFRVTDTGICYFVRNERVYSASTAGTINYYLGDGVQVRKGTSVLAVTPQVGTADESAYVDLITKLSGNDVVLQNYVTQFKGVTSYYIDGYESYFTPDTMRDLVYTDVKKLEIESINVTRTSTLAKEPLYKICDNSLWYIVCWVKPGNISKYQVGKTVSINLPASDIKATITDIIDQDDMWLVIFESDRYYKDFGKIRSVTATIVTSDYNGILISNESLATKGDEVGVYVKAKGGDFNFVPVSPIMSDGNSTLVEVSTFTGSDGKPVDTVKIYDEILKKPN